MHPVSLQDRREKTSFFNWFYFFVNIGSLLAVTVIVWVQVRGQEGRRGGKMGQVWGRHGAGTWRAGLGRAAWR